MPRGPVLRLVPVLAMLVGCSAIPPAIDTPEREPDYGRIVAASFAASFGNTAKLGGFEISGLRRVLYTKGWSWLTCLRFESDGRRRTYAFYIQNNAVIESRFAVQSDECSAQLYSPFELHPGPGGPAGAPAAARGPGPLY